MSKAVLRYVRVSPTKARLIAREVQGMNAELALASLDFMPNKAAGIISRVIASAVANGDYEPEEVIVTSCRVDKAAVMKRWRPRARGTATRILKPTSHIYVEVGTSAESRKSEEKKAQSKSRESAKAAAKAAAESKKDAESKKTPAKAATEKKGDDLTKIKGIGKAYQQKLNSEGIFTYADVAGMNDEQIAMMEEKYSFKGDFRESVADAANFVDGKDA